MRLIDADRLVETITFSCSMGGIMGTVVDAVYGYAKHMVETAPTIKLDKHTANLFQCAHDTGITLEQAAKELERVTTPATEGDNISRQAAIDALDCINGVEEVLRSLPPAQPDTPMRGSKVAETAGNITDRTTGDCISRQAAIDALGREPTGDAEYSLGCYNEWKRNVRAIEALPPAEQRTGRWIEISSLNHTYKCSECGRLLVNIADGKNNVAKNYPYCHCGARMEGGNA